MEFSHDPQRLGEDVKALFYGATSAMVVAPFITKPGLLPLIAALAPGGVSTSSPVGILSKSARESQTQ